MALYKIEKDASGVPTGETTLIAGATNFADNPLGTILPFGSDKIPSGWLLCDGRTLQISQYNELFNVIGTAFGGDGSTTFNIPDMRESVPKGAGLTSKSNVHYDIDGVALGEFVEDRIANHTHDFPQSPNMSYVTGSGNYKTVPVSGGSTESDGVHTGYRYGATTEVKSVGVNYIIKAKMIAVPADFLNAVEQSVEDVYGDIIPSDASASNKLVTTNGKADRISTTHWISDNFNNAVPTDGASFEVFTVLNSASNTPKTGANYVVTAIAFQSGIIQQEAVQNGTNNRYIRYLDNGTWSSWQKLVIASDINTVTAGTATNTANVTSGTCTWTKKGSVVVVTINSFTPVTYTGGDRQLATGLPKPISYTAWGCNSVDGSKNQLFSIGTNGTLMGASGSMQGGVPYYQTMTYLTND